MTQPDVVLRFRPDASWLKPPDYWALGLISDVAIDRDDRLWIGSRGDYPVTVWDRSGRLIGSWGRRDFVAIHGLTVTDDAVWIADYQLHVVRCFDFDGTLRLELGTRGRARPAVTHHGLMGDPFNMPTAVAVDRAGRIFVADGYGNRRVHRFSSDGVLEASWGRPGGEPGEFAIVHGITVDSQDRIVVSDRENGRVQFFDADGNFLEEWTDLLSPAAVCEFDGSLYAVEMGHPLNHQPNGLSQLGAGGRTSAQWRTHGVTTPMGGHGLAMDSQGSVFLADIAGRRVIKLNRED